MPVMVPCGQPGRQPEDNRRLRPRFGGLALPESGGDQSLMASGAPSANLRGGRPTGGGPAEPSTLEGGKDASCRSTASAEVR